MVVAARFAQHHAGLLDLWQQGSVSVEAVAALARGTRALPDDDVTQVVDALLPTLPRLSLRYLKIAVNRAVDLLLPQDRNQRDHLVHGPPLLDVRRPANGVTMFQGQVPSVAGRQRFSAALGALAESLRVDGDGLTRGQRLADALLTMVNAAAAHGDLPASASGLPVATTVTVGVSEADRIALGHRPHPSVSLTDAVAETNRPGGLAGAPTTTGHPG